MAVILVGCASTGFNAYEGRNNGVEVKGGPQVVVDGMDLWDNGDPPRHQRDRHL